MPLTLSLSNEQGSSQQEQRKEETQSHGGR